jgi:hypothetical protein
MLAKYISAIWSDVVARMSGLASLAFTVFGVFSDWFSGIKGGEHAREFCWSAAVICFLYANYRIWADEHRKRICEQPKFIMNIEHLNWEYQEDQNNTVFIMAVFLLNQGAPSVARGWSAVYEIGDSTETLNLIHVAQWVLRVGMESVTITGPDQIPSKTLERRLETGEAKHGRILFTIPGDRVEQIRSLQFKVRLRCRDFLGNLAETSFSPSSIPVTGVPIYPTEHGEVLPMPPESASGTPQLPSEEDE